ncbi:hypothetical protein SAMN05216499_101493 [Actinacidiphila paucisporea]|uniref:Uncharacterized protein n=1 Tax=Actinacidiphila paucisporea TaxID=310782 RepID=A0A1M6UUY1_9ACTN|nr:hypothetical protein SAMN05216499_101493 [Actinacidiphila paucisporea]
MPDGTDTGTGTEGFEEIAHEKVSLLRQPTAVWATAGAAVVAFMGIGLAGAAPHHSGSAPSVPVRTPA